MKIQYAILFSIVLIFANTSWGNVRCVDLFYNSKTDVAGPPPLTLVNHFVGEETGIFVARSTGIFGPPFQGKVFVKNRYVRNPQELEMLRSAIDETGKLIHNFGDNYRFIFIVTMAGNLRVFPEKTGQSSGLRLKHSALAQGEPVLMAGEIELNFDGTIHSISRQSGHYLPTQTHLRWFVNAFIPETIRARIKFPESKGFQ